MKARILAVVLVALVGVFVLLSGRQAQAVNSAAVAVEDLFTALNAGEVDAAVAYFAEDAVAENWVRGERYSGAAEIAQMLRGMQRDGRRFDLQSVSGSGDTVMLKVEVSDRGLVWGTQTILVGVADGKIESFKVTGFRLDLWRTR